MKTSVQNLLRTLLLIPAFLLLQGCGPQIPKTVEIKSDSLVFQDWNEEQDFFKQLADFAKTILPSSLDEVANQSATQTEMQKQQLDKNQKEVESEFRAEGKILDIPVGTKIEIIKYCDENGNEVKPVWSDDAKSFFTPDGNTVFVTGEWQDKTVITMLTTDESN